jgi:hypothetical protein
MKSKPGATKTKSGATKTKCLSLGKLSIFNRLRPTRAGRPCLQKGHAPASLRNEGEGEKFSPTTPMILFLSSEAQSPIAVAPFSEN